LHSTFTSVIKKYIYLLQPSLFVQCSYYDWMFIPHDDSVFVVNGMEHVHEKKIVNWFEFNKNCYKQYTVQGEKGIQIYSFHTHTYSELDFQLY